MNDELVEDPLFRYRYRFAQKGDSLRVEMWVEPGGGVSIEHYHPVIEERFEVLDGEITFKVDGEKVTAGAGESATAKPGSRHTFENTGEQVAHVVCDARPPGKLQGFLTEAADLARRGRYTRGGLPKPWAMLELADFTERYKEDVVVTSFPPALQRVVMPPLARLYRRRRGKAAA